jgi:hypothetical protein
MISQARMSLGTVAASRGRLFAPKVRGFVQEGHEMTDEPTPTPPPRRPFVPLMDRLGELCRDGKEAAEYLWQVPHDHETRQRIAAMLVEIQAEAAKQNRREMGRLAGELEAAAKASPSPQQVELLQDGFDRLTRLWAAAKSGLF